MGQMRCSSSQLRLLARRPQLTRCSAIEGERQERQVHEEEAARIDPARNLDSGSWLQGNATNADPYLGWTSDGSEQPHNNSASGWIKIGGVAVLAIGFALGARSMYTKREITKEFAVLPRVTEEAVHASSKVLATIERQDHVEAFENSEAPNSNSGASLAEAKDFIGGEAVTDVQHQEESTPDRQVSVPNQQTEDYRENEVSDKDSSATATMPTLENLEHEKILETSAADENLLSPPEDAKEKGSDATDVALPAVMDASIPPGKEEASQDATETANSADEDDNLDANLSSPAFTLAEGNIADILQEPDTLITASKELANEGNGLLEDVTSLSGPTLDESSLHNFNTVEDLQGASSDLHVLGSLAREGVFEKMIRQHDEWGEGKPSTDLFASSLELNQRFLSATITAPSTPSESLPNLLGKVVVPAPVDHMQEQILAALQALKVIEADVKPGDICTRREYARWLMAASAILTRTPAHKVLPAMYIENASVLAYEDVVPEDQDFPFIQGLAEAGLLSSRLLGDDQHHEGGDKDNDFVFAPDSPLTRQDLVTWKVALERKPAVLDGTSFSDGIEEIQKKFGFIDADKIHVDAWPALLIDINAGEQSITALAFGHTRRLQPQKPVSKAQAAVALATGEAWELVSEELARLEAESVAEAAVVAELALETKAQQEMAAAFQELLQVEREKQQEAASLVESTRAELEQVKAEREHEKYSLLKDRAALDSQKEILSSARIEIEQQQLALSNAKLEVAFQREQADKLRAEAEDEKALISKVRSELEIEKNALILARSWAEDEARKAQAHSKALEEVRNQWESQDVQMNVEKELDTVNEKVNSFSPSWQYIEGSQDQTSPMDRLMKQSRDVGRMFVDAFIRFLQFIQLIFHAIKESATDVFGKVGGKFHEARIKCADSTTKTVEGLKQTVPSSVAGITSSIRDGTLKVVDEWKGGAERLSQKFKTS